MNENHLPEVIPAKKTFQEGSPPEIPSAAQPERADEVGEVHLIYKIEGQPNEVPVFELARTLEALGNVISESDHVVNRDSHEVLVKVKPFQEGSFLIDLVLSVQHNPAVLFFLTHPEALERIKTVLEYLGLIKKGREILASLRELIEFLKNGKPEKVEPVGENRFAYTNHEGQELIVSGTVDNLVNNITIQNFFFDALGGPMQRSGIEGITTYIKDAANETRVYWPKEEVEFLRAFSNPEPEQLKIEVVENTTTEFLNPKAGTYGEPEGLWTFTRAGTKVRLRAAITDQKFLSKFERGAVRFFRDDMLKVRLKHEQTLKDGRATNRYEIVEVLSYTKAPVHRDSRRSRR